MNKVQILGTLTSDVELRYATNGTAIGKLNIAVNKRYTSNGERKEEVSYFECVAFGKTAENIANYFPKGNRILISGELKQDRWDKDGKKQSKVSILIDGFDFIERSENKPNTQPSKPKVEVYNNKGDKTEEVEFPDIDINDSEIPF